MKYQQRNIGPMQAIARASEYGAYISWRLGPEGPEWYPSITPDAPAQLRALADDLEQAMGQGAIVPFSPGCCTAAGSGTCPPAISEG